MKSTNPKTLRAQMKTYLDLAANEPLRILRRSGESYVLINEKRFSAMHEEILYLQRRLLLSLSGASERLELRAQGQQ